MRYCIFCRTLSEKEILGILIEELCVLCEQDAKEYEEQQKELEDENNLAQ